MLWFNDSDVDIYIIISPIIINLTILREMFKNSLLRGTINTTR